MAVLIIFIMLYITEEYISFYFFLFLQYSLVMLHFVHVLDFVFLLVQFLVLIFTYRFVSWLECSLFFDPVFIFC